MPILITQVGFYVLLLIGGGSAYFAMAVLVSSLIEGEYTAPAVAFGLVLLTAIVSDAWLPTLQPLAAINWDFYIDRHTYLLSWPFPWRGTLASMSAAALMLLTAVKVIQKREF
jgi:hypothetical protein